MRFAATILEKTMNKAIAESSFNNQIRAEVIFNLAAQFSIESWPDDLEEAIEEHPESILPALGFDEDHEVTPEEFGGELFRAGKFGFLVQFAAPVPDFMTGGSMCFSWGHYTTHWVYADTFEEAWALGEKWQNQYHEKQRAKQAA